MASKAAHIKYIWGGILVNSLDYLNDPWGISGIFLTIDSLLVKH